MLLWPPSLLGLHGMQLHSNNSSTRSSAHFREPFCLAPHTAPTPDSLPLEQAGSEATGFLLVPCDHPHPTDLGTPRSSIGPNPARQ